MKRTPFKRKPPAAYVKAERVAPVYARLTVKVNMARVGDEVVNLPKSCYDPAVSAKKALTGFGDSKMTAAQSRSTAQSCGFFVRAPVLAARMGGREACRLSSSAVVPVRQPVRAASPFGDGVAVVPRRQLEYTMASSASGKSAQITSIVSALTGANAPRALLVSLDRNGQLEHTPLAIGESVLNIGTDIQDHLSAQPVSTEWLLNLRDYIDCRLAAREEAKAFGAVSIARKNGFDIARINAFTPVGVSK